MSFNVEMVIPSYSAQQITVEDYAHYTVLLNQKHGRKSDLGTRTVISSLLSVCVYSCVFKEVKFLRQAFPSNSAAANLRSIIYETRWTDCGSQQKTMLKCGQYEQIEKTTKNLEVHLILQYPFSHIIASF